MNPLFRNRVQRLFCQSFSIRVSAILYSKTLTEIFLLRTVTSLICSGEHLQNYAPVCRFDRDCDTVHPYSLLKGIF